MGVYIFATSLHTYIPMHVPTYLPTYITTYLPTYIHTHTHTHTYIHTYIHTFLQNIGNITPNIMELNEVSQIKTFMSKNIKCLFAKLICDMFLKRHDSLFI